MIEPLEPRVAPAALTHGGKVLTFTDFDGDLARVIFSTPMIQDVIFFEGGFKPGDITTPQKLLEINLNGKSGASLTATATPQKVNNALKGDSHVNIRLIEAVQTDLGTVKVDGDLLQIMAGDFNPANGPGIKNLTVLSMGKDGGSSGSQISGIGTLVIKTDLAENAYIEIFSGAKSITIGGSILGSNGSGGSLSVGADGVQKLKIGGSLHANGAPSTGNIRIAGDVGTLSIGGSIIGREGGSTSAFAQITINGDVGVISVRGDLIGRNTEHGGDIEVKGSAGKISIGGSILGSRLSFTGLIVVNEDLRSLRVGGDIIGGTSLGGSIVNYNGSVLVGGSLGSVTIGGDFLAGQIVDAGGRFTQSGMIGARGTIGTVKIGGSINGAPGHFAYILAGGLGAENGAPAIKKISVRGSIIDTSIVAGYDQSFIARNLEAGIGSVSIGGNLEASNIIAGSNKGSNDIPGDEDDITVNGIATIGAVRIGGAFLGRLSDITSYYVYAPHILLFQVGKAKYNDLQLQAGPELSSIGSAIVFSSPK